MEPTTLIADAIATYVARVAERGRGTAAFPRTRSHQTYGYALHSFELFLAETRAAATTIADLGSSDLTEYTRWLSRRYQATTVQLYTTALKGFSQRNLGAALTIQTIADICEKHLGTPKVHTLRHTFARAMEDAGAKVSDIQARLGHTSLATTGRYVTALKQAENTHGETLVELFGIGET